MTEYDKTLRDIETSLGLVPDFMKALPEDVLLAQWPLFKKYTLGQSTIPAKFRELIGLAIAANIKCPYCELFHTGAAKMQGATDAELAEVAFLAGYTASWSAIIHAQHYDYNKFEKEFQRIGDHLSKAMSTPEMSQRK